jgi:hypothetical protein
LRRGGGDRESRTGDREAERGADRACAERVGLGDRVRDRSREMLRERERDADRAGDGLREGILKNLSSTALLVKCLLVRCTTVAQGWWCQCFGVGRNMRSYASLGNVST